MTDDVRRVTLWLLVAVFVAAVAAMPAVGKEGVEARLTAAVPLDAEPGTRLRVAWTLTYLDGDTRRPFDASGIFVRLISASGARPQSAFAPTEPHARGKFAATVVVPEGGIGDIEIGLLGWASGPGGTRRSDLLFPITNDPVPASARPLAAPSNEGVPESARPASTGWILAVGVTALLFTCAFAVALARRSRAHHA